MRSLIHDESGATAVEYALMVALVALVIIVAVTALGGSVSDKFEDPVLNGVLGGS